MPTGAEEAKQQAEALRVGDVVERDIDGIWFPAKILAVHERRHETESADRSTSGGWRPLLAYDLIYLDDHNRESEVPEEDIRALYDDDTNTKGGLRSLRGGGDARGVPRARGDGGILGDVKAQEEQDRAGADEYSRGGEGEGNEKRVHDHDDFNNYCDDQEGPKVTIHSSHGTFDTKEDGSATAYIINGPETNVAAGSGLRGIRWLRGP